MVHRYVFNCGVSFQHYYASLSNTADKEMHPCDRKLDVVIQ